MKIAALRVNVYRNDLGDSTAGGISSIYRNLYLIGEDIKEGNTTIDSDNIPENTVYLERRILFGKEEYLTAYPVSKKTDGKWYMFGGNFIYTSDSRFPSNYPIPIHDRVEN